MADKLQVLIEAILAKTTKEQLASELKKIENGLKPIEIKADVDKIVKDFKVLSDGSKELQKVTTEITNQYGQQVKVIEKVDKETKELIQDSEIVTDNYKKQRQELEAIQKQQQKLKDDFYKKNISGYDYAIKQRELEGQQFATQLKSQMQQEQELAIEKQTTLEIQRQLNLYREQLAIRNQNLRTTYGKSYDSAGMGSIINSANNLKASDFKTVSELKNATKQLDVQVEKSTANMRTLRREATLAMKESDTFFTTLAKDFGKMVAWTVVGTALFGTIRQIKQALDMLKELDTLMVDIAKVTDLTADEMERLVKSSFDASSAYGRTAQDYLKGVAEFSRAGYEEAAKGLSEVSLLAQNVGELTAEQANQFLLATDAAYKYSGSQEKLTRVLDGVNQIDNEFATSISKISEGMTVAGSIASNAGIGVNELSAAIGTMTAVTQKSGNEMGRAFRGLVMNLRQIKGDVGDGEIIDEEALSKSAKALDSVNIKVHEMRNGIEELRNPMDIIEELANKWDTLSSMQQAPIIEALGGKYRGNAVVALLENFNMYEKMLGEYATAAGSAMDENAKRMDSWQVKLNQLSNAVGKAWKESINTESIKDIIDGLTYLVETFGNLNTVIVYTGVALAAWKGKAIIDTLNAMNLGLKLNIATLPAYIMGLGTAQAATLGLEVTTSRAKIAMLGLGQVLKANWFGLLLSGIALTVTAFSIYEKHQKEIYQNTINNAKTLKEESSNTAELMKSISDLSGKQKLSNDERERLGVVQSELSKIYPDILNNINLEKASYDDLARAVRDATEAKKEQVLQDLRIQKTQLESEIKNMRSAEDRWSLRGLDNVNYNKQIEEKQRQLAELSALTTDVLIGGSLSDQIEKNRLGTGSKARTTGGTSGGKGSSSLPELKETPVDKDSVDLLIKAYNAESEIVDQKNKAIERQLKLNDEQKDYNKEIELSNQLMAGQKQKIVELGLANEKIHQEANRLREQSPLIDTTKWFDQNNQLTPQFDEDYNAKNREIEAIKASVNLKDKDSIKTANEKIEKIQDEQKAMEVLRDKLLSLKQAYGDNTLAIETTNDAIEATKKSIEQLKIDKLKAEFDKFDKSLEHSNSRLALMKEYLSSLSGTNYDEKSTVLGRLIGDTDTNTAKLEEEFNKLLSYDYTEVTSERLKELSEQIDKNKLNVIEWQEELNAIKIQKFLNEIDRANQALNRQADQMMHNIEMMQGGVLTGTDISTLAEYGLDLDVEFATDKELKDLQDNREERLSLIEEFDKKEQEQLDEAKAEEYLALEDYNAETIFQVETFLNDMNAKYGEKWEEILSNIRAKLAEAKRLQAELLDIESSSSVSVGDSSSTTSGGHHPPPMYASGTSGTREPYNIVGEKGYELAILPNGKVVLVGTKGWTLANLPKGTKILPHNETQKVLSQGGIKNIPHYASGNTTLNQSTISFNGDDIESKIIEAWNKLIGAKEKQRKKAKEYIEQLVEERDTIGEGNKGYEELNEKIYEQIQIINDIDSALRSAVKSKWETITTSFDKNKLPMSEQEDNIGELQRMNELYKDNVEYLDVAIELNNQQLINAQSLNDELLKEKQYLTEQLALLEKDSYEWNIVNDELKEINEQLEDAVYNIESISLENLELAFENIQVGLRDMQSGMSDLEYELDLINTLNPEELDDINKVYDRMTDNVAQQIDYLNEALDSLIQQQSLLEANSAQWQVIGNQISSVIAQIRQANLQLASMLRTQYSSSLDQYRSQFTAPSGGGSSGGGGGGGGGSSRDDSDDYIEGLEKELELEKLMNFVEQNKLTLSQAQLKVLNAQGKIKKSSLDMIQKELELQQLQTKLENLKNQQQIQTLKQQEDGSWQYEYVADQEAINELENDILDKRLDILQAQKDIDKAEKEGSSGGGGGGGGSSTDKYEQLNNILDKAEQRVYKSAEEFRKALEALDIEDLPIDKMVAEYWEYFIQTAELYFEVALKNTIEILNAQAKAFEESGNEAGKSYIQGLLDSIDDIMSGDGDVIQKQQEIIAMLSSKYTEFALAGNQAGMEYIKGLIKSMETVDFTFDFDSIAYNIQSSLLAQVETLKSSGQMMGASIIEGLLAGIDAILADDTIANKTQAILDLFNKANEYGTLGQALGESFMNGLISIFQNMSDEVVGDGEGVLAQAINAITAQLDTKIMEFAEKGDLQGVAYAEALRNKLEEALQNAELTQADIIQLLSQFKDFDLAGLLSGEAYEEALELGFIDAEETTGEQNSAIIQGLQEDVARFSDAGKAQGEAYENAIVSAFTIAVKRAKDLINSLTNYINSQSYDINVNTSGTPTNTENIARAASGGMTPKWGSDGRLMFVDEGELILNKIQTKDILQIKDILKNVNMLDGLMGKIPRTDFSKLALNTSGTSQQVYNIDKLVLPNVTNNSGVENLVNGLRGAAIQHSHKK